MKIRTRCRLAWAALTGQQAIQVELQSGQRLRVRINDRLGREIFRNESFERAIRDRMIGELKTGAIVLDIGANIGYYTVQLAARVGPAGRVIAFEPNPSMVKELDSNLRLNSLSNVSIQPIALSNENGEAEFYCPPAGKEAHGSLAPNASFAVAEVVKVKTRRLDDILQDLGVQRVHLIKVDAEGAERSIFRGAERTLSQDFRPIIFFECAETACRPFGHSVFDVLRELSGYGYAIEQLDYGNWLAKPAPSGERSCASPASSLSPDRI